MMKALGNVVRETGRQLSVFPHQDEESGQSAAFSVHFGSIP